MGPHGRESRKRPGSGGSTPAGWAKRISSAPVVLDMGSGEVPPGVATKAEIQAIMELTLRAFAISPFKMASHADALEKAAEARDPVLAGVLTNAIGDPSQSCHVRYWYEQ